MKKIKISLLILLICLPIILVLIPSKKESLYLLSEKTSKLDVYVFTSSTCPYCKQFKKEYFPVLKKEFGDKVNFLDIVLNTADKGNYQLYHSLSAQCHISGVPLVVVGNNCIVGYPHNIKGNTETAIENTLKERGKIK